MNALVHGYEEAHFAACLLECGPHVYQANRTVVGTFHASNAWQGNDYRDRVYAYFFDLFPTYLDVPEEVRRHVAHEWAVFWREYLEWVEK